MDLFNDFGAHFSQCRRYRFALWRIWDNTKPLIMFIGLNPSTANETEPDPTITRVIGFAKRWGYGGVYMMNCFPFVSTDPDGLNYHGYKDFNDQLLKEIGAKCKEIIFAWGNFKIVREVGRDAELIEMFPNAKALIINQNGSPRHPLYVKGETVPIPYAGGVILNSKTSTEQN